ncbi:MAG: hypothetical protein EBW75_03770 [Actinobacteria bacterium]|nr:hypothetical protein [Actinomycetota bacterium]
MAEATPLYQIRLAVRAELTDLSAGDTVLVAVSGGADSLALAAGLLTEAKEKAIRPIAVIIDHALQPNSADVAMNTKAELAKAGYTNIEIKRIKVEITDGMEASARRANDPHNQSMEYARVRVREKVLPLMESEIGPGIADALTRSAKILRDDADALDQWAEEVLDEIDPIEIDIETLASLPRAIRSRVIRKAIYLAGAPSGSLSAEHLEPVEALVTAWKGQGPVSLPGGVTVARISGRLSLS